MFPFIIICLLVCLDQIVKFLCVHFLSKPITLIPHIIELRYLENRGAAFGIMQDNKIFLVLLPIAIIVGLVVFYKKLGNTKADKITKMALILIVSGAIGNLIDRVLNGYVVDMFNFLFMNFAIFNIADILVVCGTLLLIIGIMLTDEDKK